MKNKIAPYLFTTSIATGVYLGLFNNIEGVNNIGLTFLWILGVLLFIATLIPQEKKRTDIGFHKYLLRIIYLSSVTAIIYMGHIALGVIYIYTTIILWTNTKDNK